ncbi:cyclic peptide export ABC transporter [Phreatobacter stygius]|uniref:Cyclic peptide export ABC transporter n=1 Tax=Phreatobacter stygius TaxID=1940610 RepID=A0A4D7AZE7_9HYPH|nr:cyclic peptide export ABC transporter [Phreatobacter stygius]QCI64018.1 cyclic peptide export ABC transporter [Phreatobacter stygius]
MVLNRPHILTEAGRLLRPFWPMAAFATAMGGLSGVATAWLLATINRSFHSEDGVTTTFVLTFAGLVLLTFTGKIVSDLGNSFVGQHVVANLRKELTGRILAAPIDRLERFRAHRLIVALNQDAEMISAFTSNFSALTIAASVTLGCIVYLVILSPMLFLIAALAIAAGLAINTYARRKGIKGFEAARAAQDELQKHYRGITEGAKELRLNRQRRARAHGVQLAGAIDGIRNLRLRAMRIFATANAVGSAVFFAAIGVLIALQAGFSVDRSVLSGFVLVLLYVKGPIDQLTGSLPLFEQAQISFKRVAELSAEFANPEPGLLIDAPQARPDGGDGPQGLRAVITLTGLSHAFPAAEGTEPFVLGPIDLSIRRGETLFIVGENGCGKTTLIKVILGLYAPQEGVVAIDGMAVTDENRDAYRQLFSAVFFDYFLFDDLVMAPGTPPATVQAYLERLEIAHRVTIADGRFSTTDLSAGQKKRLALIQVYLEGRPIIVFDEWAAEQDPTFRRIFYDELLLDLKRQGKTLIVISHDDRYFGAADRIVRMEKGRIVEVTEPSASRAPGLSDAPDPLSDRHGHNAGAIA